MKRIILLSLAILLTSFCMASTASPDSLKRYSLQAIRVIADMPEASIGSLSIVPIKESVSTAHDAMQKIPGLSATMGTKGESNLRIRGFRKNEVLILVDGRPLTSGYFGSVDISKIPLADIQEIAIIRGPASAMYGSGTMGGVVNLITRPKNHLLSLETRLMRNNSNLLSVSSSRYTDAISYSLGISREQKSGFVLSDSFEQTVFENGAIRDHERQTSYRMDSSIDFLVADLHEFGLSLGGTLIPYKEIPSSIYTRDYRTYKDLYRSQLSLRNDLYTSPNSNLRYILYYDAAGDTYERFHDAEHQFLDISSTMHSYNLGLNPHLEYRFGESSVIKTGGKAEYRSSRRKDTGFYTDWTSSWTFISSAFAQYETQLSESLDFSASMGLTGFLNQISKSSEFVPEPALGLYFQPHENGKTSISAGINSALPTMRQLFSSDSGNPDLKASQAMKYELSHEQQFGTKYQIFGDVKLFYNDIENLIERQGEQYQNLYKVQTYGFETSLVAKPFPFWQMSLDYSWLKYASKDDYHLTDSPPQSIGLQQQFLLPWDMGLNLISLWKSDRYSQDDSSVYHTLPSYHSHRIELNKNWNRYGFGLSCDNILDADYQTEYGYPAAGRDYQVILKVRW